MAKKLCYSSLMLLTLVICAYLLVANIPYQSKKNNMDYYQNATEKPLHRDKEAIRSYCKRNGLNTNVCILVNYSIRSGQPRFFVFDFNKNKIVYRTKCAHGLGGGSTARKPVFSNSYGSKCSSLGKFAFDGIGSVHFRNCIRLRGLDRTNSNAAKRGILIHSAKIVTIFRWLPWIPLNSSCEGCFTITKDGLMKMHEIYEHESNKNILLYAYN